MSEELSTFKLKRDQLKGTLTRFRTYLETFDSDIDIDQIKVYQINARLDKIQPLYDEFTQVQNEIELLVPLSDISKENGELFSFENDYFDAVAKATLLVSKFETKQSPNGSVSNASVRSSHSQQSQNNQSSFSVKLPEMKLPAFSGSYDKWLEFRDAFNAMIDKNDSLNTIQKFYYLRAHLEGEALQMIASIKVTEQNYDVALSLLKQRYENNRLIIFNYVKALFDAPPVTRESYTDLRNLFDTFTKNIRSLEALGQAVDQWSILLIYLITSKFDPRTRRDWEAYKFEGELPTLENVNKFLKEKCELLEKLEVAKGESNRVQKSFHRNKSVNAYVSSQNGTGKFVCFYCKNSHSVFKCASFAKLDVNSRNREAKRLQLCLNCLNPSHSVQECSKPPCKKCNRHINSLLHIDGHLNSVGSQHNRSDQARGERSGNSGRQGSIARNDNGEQLIGNNSFSLEQVSALHLDNKEPDEDKATASSRVALLGRTNKYTLLSTAEVFINDPNNHKRIFKARMLLDPGSQTNFITERLCNKLGLCKQKTNIAISGIGNSESIMTHYKTDAKIKSYDGNFSRDISCLVLNEISHRMPICSFDPSFLKIPEDIALADPEFNINKEIDILCGVSLFYDILLSRQIKLDKNLFLQSTKLGWIIAGEINSFFTNNKVFSCLSVEEEINKNLVRFWEIEECDSVAKLDDVCESHFKANHSRRADGRFIVKIPFTENKNQLGNSKQNALRCFEFLERRLLKNRRLKQQYDDFMFEYEKLGHMTLLTDNIHELSDDGAEAYYLSHHAVIKASSLTTRLRVVFNGSARTDSGLSLNDIQYTGPTIQNDLLTILLNFRKPAFVLNADISKMYRQVIVDSTDRRYQRIFWRSEQTEKLKCYELNVVTYGLASSPFLATRCLLQLAIENEREYPLASNAIKNCFYIDDLLTGSDSESELLQVQTDISKILSSAGFELRKYLSNRPELFTRFDINTSLDASILKLGENENNKTLGVYWNAYYDTIEYQVQKFSDFSSITKRSILSIIGQIFDILGLLGPIIIRAKIILQTVWKNKLSWDEEISGILREKWISFCTDLMHINQIKIPRHVFCKNPTYVELHTFSDSSEASYGACAYIRCQLNDTEFSCRLISAKSKVAPLRPVTLPRLELTGAVLACRLAEKVKTSLTFNFNRCFYWSDSTITLSWIKASPDRWKKFVANRVGVIQNKSNIEDWFHVKSQDNPADLISRGISAESLINNVFWFEGPHWLKLPQSCWPQSDIIVNQEIPEQRVQVNLGVTRNDWDIFARYSNLVKLQRVVALCKRFIFNLRHKKSERIVGELDPHEIDDALYTLVKVSQVQSFRSELNELRNKNIVSNSSGILSLNPFLENNVLRVGGRIQNSDISYHKKHPAILHNKHKLTELIMRNEHIRLLHCGPQQLLNSVRERFWPISGRNLARQITHKCVICFKAKPKPYDFLMGNLPSERLTPSSPFLNTGCDYAGFFLIKDKKTRGYKLIKAYVCIFVCMVTKAIHLELVTSLSSDAFLATFRRFISRRGKPLNVFSDNGTNFTGANSELENFLKSSYSLIKHNLANEGVNWRFIPPRAPHFGGLWEAGVRSVKQHLKRVVGNTYLDFEDFTTVLQQIEAVLNSRPLSPLSSSPDDISPLTPGHFLIGRSLVSLPDPDVTKIKENRLSKFQRLQQLTQHFWKRWYKECISEMQVRQKWNQRGSSAIQVGELVVIKDDNLPPLRWKLARVAELFPGSDGVVRVINVRFSDGSCATRAINKVCPLPLDTELTTSVS